MTDQEPIDPWKSVLSKKYESESPLNLADMLSSEEEVPLPPSDEKMQELDALADTLINNMQSAPVGTFAQAKALFDELKTQAENISEAVKLVDAARKNTGRPGLPTIEEVAARLQNIDYRLQAVEIKLDAANALSQKIFASQEETVRLMRQVIDFNNGGVTVNTNATRKRIALPPLEEEQNPSRKIILEGE